MAVMLTVWVLAPQSVYAESVCCITTTKQCQPGIDRFDCIGNSGVPHGESVSCDPAVIPECAAPGCCILSGTNVCQKNQNITTCQRPNNFWWGVPDCDVSIIPQCSVGGKPLPVVRTTPTVSKTGTCIAADGSCTAGMTEAKCKAANGTYSVEQSCSLYFTPNVEIPGLFTGASVDETLFGRYVSAFYIFFAGVAGILAVVMIMYGGFHYIVSLGNPQRMKEGKDVINNAIIGLMLVLTSYLILYTINPNLTTLIIPPVGYQNAIYQSTGVYCEAHDAANGGEENGAVKAAVEQEKFCTDQPKSQLELTVRYKDKNGNDKECISLALDDSTLREQEGLWLKKPDGWKEQKACFPSYANGKLTYQLRDVAGTGGVCEEDDYTPDSACLYTDSILALQQHLLGGCKLSDIRGWVTTGKDVCHYYPIMKCPADFEPTQCDYAGGGVESECSYTNGPKYISDVLAGNIRAYCVAPNESRPVEHVNSLCCSDTVKQYIICAESLSPTGIDYISAEKLGYRKVDCGRYNKQPGNYAVQKITDTAGTTRTAGQNRYIFSVEPGGSGSPTCVNQCWALTRLYSCNPGSVVKSMSSSCTTRPFPVGY